jgi:hypothetical protein
MASGERRSVVSRKTLCSAVLVALAVIAVGAVPSVAWFYHAGGAVELPNGDRLPDFPVRFYNANGWLIGYTYTNSVGIWSYSFANCNIFVTACVGPYRLKTTECVTELIQCSGTTHFDTIVLECGGPKQPPCPHP